MKKVFLLAVMAMSLFSCTTFAPYKTVSYTTDFTKYSSKNFFMSEANSVSFEYTPIGTIASYSISGSTKDESVVNEGNPYTFDEKTRYKHGNVADALQELYETAIKKGANGVINIKVDYFYPDKTVSIESGYVISGMMIKR